MSSSDASHGDGEAALRERMGTHNHSKRRKLVRAAFRRWTIKRKPGEQPSRELRRSW